VPVCSSCGTENPDIAKFCLACGSPLAAAPPPQEYRKVVTIVFSDLKGSTAMGEKLDSESLREVMTRYFDSMRVELERHGGVIEKFIGDAIMAVFGLPKLHEDDALRAVRAAMGMNRAQAELNDELERQWGVRLTVRTGVNTGEVVAGDPTTGQRLVTGDAVNVAARLEQAAGAQEVLLGDLTYRLVRDYVQVEPVEPLELKGKSERVPAYRLVNVLEDAERPRRLDAPMVGRTKELETLESSMRCSMADGRCRLVTIIGEAGVGKSRLIDELIRSVEGDASVLRGRCLPYGDGITFWPLAEAVRQAAGIGERDSTEVATEKLAGLTDDAEVAERVASAIGLSGSQFPVEELYWGARKLLEGLARRRPLLVLFEDVHWAEPTFLDLVEHVVASAESSALLLVCSSRHDLLDTRPDWSTTDGAERIVLERLSADEAGAVAEHLLGQAGLDPALRERIVEAAEGNPLFVEQLLSMLVDEGAIRFEDGAWRAASEIDHIAVPPTIQALLATRLDYLEPDERSIIEPASVIGQLFVAGAVRHLVPDRLGPEVDLRLGTLEHKQLVETDDSRPEEDAYRFHHILIRDTAYDGILKRARATFHEQFVEWADSVNREGATEYEEILGYHLEQAHRYLSELGPLDDQGRALGLDAARRLASAGRRAFARGDIPAAANLLGRAVSILEPNDATRLELLPEHGEALMQVGRFADAETVLDEAIVLGRGAQLPSAVAHASLVRLLVRLRISETEHWRDEAAETIAQAMAVFEESGDDAGLAKAWRLLAWTHGTSLQFGLAAEASSHARAAGDTRQRTQAATAYAAAAVFGPTPVHEAIDRSERIVAEVRGDRHSEGIVLALLASLKALQGSFDEARLLVARSRSMLEDLGLGVRLARVAHEAWRVEMLAGEVEAAERELRVGYDLLSNVGERYLLSTLAGLLGQTLYALGRYDEVEALGQQARDLATPDDIDSQALWRCVLAKVHARREEHEEAGALVREALAVLEPTDAVLLKHAALLDSSEVSTLAGRPDDAGAAVDSALELAQLKESDVLTAAAEAARASARRSVVS
jgi:class 3 adenylate cyclase/tetratricopeptide (TPR) repeat protein